jgi:putative oxidoreductase
MFRRLVATSATWFAVPVRLAIGGVFLAHGSQKVLGSFGGGGLAKFVANPAPYPFMKPAWLWMGVAAFSELIGGVLLVFGFLTRVGAFFLACTMGVAVFGVHWPHFFAPAGIEYPMVLLAGCLALLISGGGAASVDLGLTRSGGRRR